MKDVKLYKTVLAALFASLVCVTTMVVQIPSPMNGYVNLGDCFVLLSGWFLGPVYGFFAAGIGSMFADVFLGYVHYAPASFLIKGIVAVLAALLFKALKKLFSKHKRIARIISGIIGEMFMVVGYFGYAWLLLGKGLAAATSIPGNIMQGLIGIVSSILFVEMINRTGLTKKLFGKDN